MFGIIVMQRPIVRREYGFTVLLLRGGSDTHRNSFVTNWFLCALRRSTTGTDKFAESDFGFILFTILEAVKDRLFFQKYFSSDRDRVYIPSINGPQLIF